MKNWGIFGMFLLFWFIGMVTGDLLVDNPQIPIYVLYIVAFCTGGLMSIVANRVSK